MAAPTSNNEVTARRLTRLLTGSDGNGGLWGKVKDKISSSINALDVSSVGGAGKYISAISETDGKISATATTMDTTPTASSTNAVTSGGIKTALDGKASSTHVHGNITNAGALQTNDVTIANGDKLVVTDASDSNKVARTSAAFDGSSVGQLLSKAGSFQYPCEAYLSWGGQNKTGYFGPLDSALVSELGANRFAFGNPSGITIEYTRDGGTTWTDYGASNETKTGIFSCKSGYEIRIGKWDNSNKATTGTNYANYKVRVIINCGSFGIYNVFEKFVLYLSTNGSNSCYMVMSGVKQAETTDVWTNIGQMQVSGWSGFNVFNKSVSMGASTYATYKKIQFLFEARAATDTDTYGGLCIYSIFGYGGVGWTTPSTMATTGHLYSYNAGKHATFPANVTATTFIGALQGNADTATRANYLTGFTARAGSIGWGTLTPNNGYKCVTVLQYKEGNQDTGDIAFGYKAGSGPLAYELSCQIDGYFYQRTGGRRVMDVADINSSFYAPTGAGTSGQLLKSSGSGAPTWATANAALVGITVTSTSVSDGTNTFNKYTHPTTSGNKHVPSGGSSGQFLGWDSDGTAKWVANPNTDTKVKATATSGNAEYKLLATASSSPTSGALTEAVYDTDITLNPSTNTISASLARTFASSSSSTVPETPIITVSGSTDGFKLTYGSETADLGITKLFTTDDANAKLSFGNMVSSTYKEALVITNGSATLNGSATSATYANYPAGFSSRDSSLPNWGTLTSGNGYTSITRWISVDSEFVFAKKSGALSVQIDGWFYQNEGQYQVLDTSSRGAANGVASLDANGKVPTSQLTGGAKYVERQRIGTTAIDLNNLSFKNDDSKIEVVEWWDADKGKVANKPDNSSGALMMFGYGNDCYVQIANMSNAAEIYWRAKARNGAWTSWRTIPAIEHVTGIPSNPTVGTIYAL